MSDWKSFTTGPHDLLATREAAEPGKRCCLHHNSQGGEFPEHRAQNMMLLGRQSRWPKFVINLVHRHHSEMAAQTNHMRLLWKQIKWQHTKETNWIRIPAHGTQASIHLFLSLLGNLTDREGWKPTAEMDSKVVLALFLGFHYKSSAPSTTFCILLPKKLRFSQQKWNKIRNNLGRWDS